jgi:2-dehydropantoate 2-reductase
MKILVMGAGAIGSLIGGLLSASGEDVTLVGRYAHVRAIKKKGLRISGLTEKVVKVDARLRPFPADLVLLTVKSYDTEDAIKMVPLRENTVVVSIQNGYGNLEQISKYAKGRAIGGITSHASLFLSPGHVKHTGYGDTVIGEQDGRITERVKKIKKIFSEAGIPTKVTRDIRREIWKKLIVNCGINAITALASCKNGEILSRKELREIMILAVKEATEVAKIETEIKENMLRKTIDVIRKTAENESSMLQDLKRGRRTEIDAINGAIVRIAEREGMEAPLNKVLYSLVKSIEISRNSS